MRIDNARMFCGEMMLTVPLNAAETFLSAFKPGEYEITPARKKRSVNANALLWEMCEKIAAKTKTSKEDVYRKNIKEAGVYSQMYAAENAVEAFQQAWSEHGLGWFCEVVDYGEPGFKSIFAYHGSSTYNTKQMSRLIDSVMEDARAVGVETRPPEEIQSLLEAWNA